MGLEGQRGLGAWVVLLALVVASLPYPCAGIRFEITGGHSKCVGKEILANILVVGDYKGVNAGTEIHKLSVKVTSPYGNVLHQMDYTEGGQFGFTTKEAGNYMACFWITGAGVGPKMSVDLNWKTGVAAKDWDMIAKKEKLEGLEVQLRMLEDLVNDVHEEMRHLRDREAKMRDINEATNARIAWLSILSLLACIGVAAWQLWYLKSFFERKKLL